MPEDNDKKEHSLFFDDSTDKAMAESIRHWEEINQQMRDAKDEPHLNSKMKILDEVKLGPQECALCKLYYINGCDGCPIYYFTDEVACGGTSYEKFVGALEDTISFINIDINFNRVSALLQTKENLAISYAEEMLTQ